MKPRPSDTSHERPVNWFLSWKQLFSASAIRYWERRRIIYNLALVPPALFTYLLPGAISVSVGDPARLGPFAVLLLFTLCGAGANICYTLAYALEYAFGSDDPSAWWPRFGRRWAFAMGTIFGMLLAAIGGHNIHWLAYQPR